MDKKLYDAVAILAGAMLKEASGTWRTTTFDDPGDMYGPSGDRLRILAGKIIYEANPNTMLILLGGKGQHANTHDAPALSEVMKSELKELGVPEKQFITEADSANTYEQLLALKKIIINYRLKNVVIISNRYHVPRIETMIFYDKKLNTKNFTKSILINSAEDILISSEPQRWRNVINKVYASKAMEKRTKLEKNGVASFKKGVYQFKNYE